MILPVGTKVRITGGCNKCKGFFGVVSDTRYASDFGGSYTIDFPHDQPLCCVGDASFGISEFEVMPKMDALNTRIDAYCSEALCSK